MDRDLFRHTEEIPIGPAPDLVFKWKVAQLREAVKVGTSEEVLELYDRLDTSAPEFDDVEREVFQAMEKRGVSAAQDSDVKVLSSLVDLFRDRVDLQETVVVQAVDSLIAKVNESLDENRLDRAHELLTGDVAQWMRSAEVKPCWSSRLPAWHEVFHHYVRLARLNDVIPSTAAGRGGVVQNERQVFRPDPFRRTVWEKAKWIDTSIGLTWTTLEGPQPRCREDLNPRPGRPWFLEVVCRGNPDKAVSSRAPVRVFSQVEEEAGWAVDISEKHGVQVSFYTAGFQGFTNNLITTGMGKDYRSNFVHIAVAYMMEGKPLHPPCLQVWVNGRAGPPVEVQGEYIRAETRAALGSPPDRSGKTGNRLLCASAEVLHELPVGVEMLGSFVANLCAHRHEVLSKLGDVL